MLRQIILKTKKTRLFAEKRQLQRFSQITGRQTVFRNDGRPQMPFLSDRSPKHGIWQLPRLISFETKRWVKQGVVMGLKWGFIVYVVLGLGSVTMTAIYLEYIELRHPTPHEWSLWSRVKMRNAMGLLSKAEDLDQAPSWPAIGRAFEDVLARLEDPNIDGKLLKEQVDGGILVAGVGKLSYDISSYDYPWQTGYFQCLMGAARASEHVVDLVVDRTRKIVFPSNTVIGPDNPRPKPLPPNSGPPARSEDCDAFMPSPETFYLKIITTTGFTSKQRIQACTAYADWLDRRGLSDTAEEIYRWSIDIASTDLAPGVSIHQGVINGPDGVVSQNLLESATQLGVHYAKGEQLSKALPILVSVLRARRTLKPGLDDVSLELEQKPPQQIAQEVFLAILKERPYPPRSTSGNEPPTRNSTEKCEEAQLMAYIGEILYASSHYEDGVTWTRDAIDLAEENFERSTKQCGACLTMAMSNWMTMVSEQAKSESIAAMHKERAGSRKSWWSGEPEEQSTRWRSEEKEVFKRGERIKRLLRQSGSVQTL